MNTIGARVQEAIRASGKTQKDVSAAVNMTEDALSRALRGQRGFGAGELIDLAHELKQDVHVLITGNPDPNRLILSARHSYDRENGQRSVGGFERDKPILQDIQLAYQQVSVPPSKSKLPKNVAKVENLLGGHGFAKDFAAKIEALDIDVIRIPELTTAYSFSIDDRLVIAVESSANWFYQNWSLAHELAHLVYEDAGLEVHAQELASTERRANAFAAELLLPKAVILSVDWSAVTKGDLARMLWEWGISIQALQNRLNTLEVSPNRVVTDAFGEKTQSILRNSGFLMDANETDLIMERSGISATRRFPSHLLSAHAEAIRNGQVRKGTLAWMLGVSEDELEIEEPSSPPLRSTHELMDLLG